MTSLTETALSLIIHDRIKAHAILFENQHSSESAPFHAEIINALHSDHERVVIEAFRKGGKSTLSEETDSR